MVENCAFYDPVAGEPALVPTALFVPCPNDYPSREPVVIRECVANRTLILILNGSRVPVRMERNHLLSRHLALVRAGGPAVIRHNVLAGEYGGIQLHDCQAPCAVEVINNTAVDCLHTQVQVAAPDRGVTIRRNVLRAGLEFVDGAAAAPDAARERWDVGGNCYESLPPAPTRLNPSARDLPTRPLFLTWNPANRDYLRVPAGGPLATPPDGPGYAGALPPGRAPAGGDWFTRLREKWRPTPPR